MNAEMEIDPELFMICRLCVDSKGKFQILPSVQKNIKDFFDINIEPFDGLSQLICNACKIILSEFSNVKSTYQQKQKSLLERAKKAPQNVLKNHSDDDNTEPLERQASSVPGSPLEPDEIELVETNECHKEVEKAFDVCDSEKDDQPVSPNASTECDRRYSSSTTGHNSDSEPAEIATTSHKKSLRLCRLTETHTKLINCRLCKKECNTTYILKKHMKAHRALVSKHKNILRYHCYVPLKRLEGPSERTEDTVQLEPSLILEGGANQDYFITYKNRFLEPDTPEASTHRRKRSSYAEYFSESDDEKRSSRFNKRYKRLQVLSDSEESTIIPPDDSANKTSDLDTLDIHANVELYDSQQGTGLHDPCNILVERVPGEAADSTTYISDSSNDNTTTIKDKEMKLKNEEKDLNLIEQVIQTAFRRFDSNSELDKVINMKKNDIRKFLSIGRRVLTANFRATGLIKYLENNDLNINWIDQNKGSTVAQNKSKSEAHFIRIGSKMEEFPPGDNLYGFSRHDPPNEPDAPTDAEKGLLLSYEEVQKRISESNNNVSKMGNNDTNISEDHNSLQPPTAQHLLTILSRSQMPFPGNLSPADKSLSGNFQSVNIASPLNKPSGGLNKTSSVNKSSASNRSFAPNKSVAKKPPPAKVPHPLDLSDDEDDDIGQATFVMVNPASVRIKPITKKTTYMRLPTTTASNALSRSTITTTTTPAGQPSATFILNKNPVLNPKPGGVITYKNKGRQSVSKSVGNSATLLPMSSPVFEQAPVRTPIENRSPSLTSNTDMASVCMQNRSSVNTPNIVPIPTIAPAAVSAPDKSLPPTDPSPPSYYHPAFIGDTVICLDDEESCDNMPVITSTTSLATIKNERNTELSSKKIDTLSTREQSEKADQSELKSHLVNEATSNTSILKNSLTMNKTYIKCKPVHELMRTSSPHNKDNGTPSPVIDQSTVVTENGTCNTAKSTNFLSIDGTVERLTIPAPDTKNSNDENSKFNKVLLNTVMLPNLMTSSPFTYLKTLMNLQGLILLEKPDNLLVCLIKFKLGVHQPPISTMLCLYLMARPQVFCIKVTNGTTVAEVKDMSAAWQMEILKAFTDKSVMGKITDGAASKGIDLLASVKLFFSILNSIEMKIPNPP